MNWPWAPQHVEPGLRGRGGGGELNIRLVELGIRTHLYLVVLE